MSLASSEYPDERTNYNIADSFLFFLFFFFFFFFFWGGGGLKSVWKSRGDVRSYLIQQQFIKKSEHISIKIKKDFWFKCWQHLNTFYGQTSFMACQYYKHFIEKSSTHLGC